MISALTGRAMRRDVAMTGEITLRGRVLPVGGVKEKVLAAHRAGIMTLILPRRNIKDLDELPAEVREALTVIRRGHDGRRAVQHACANQREAWASARASAARLRRLARAVASRPLGETIAAAGRLERARAPRDAIIAG